MHDTLPMNKRTRDTLPSPLSKLSGFGTSPTGSARVSVIIEVQPAAFKPALSPLYRGEAAVGSRPGSRAVSVSGDPAQNRAALDEVIGYLSQFDLREPPVVLADGQVIIADLRPKDLRDLAELPQVAAIRPNVRHRAVR
jgi:hypothetical protein